MKLLFKLNYEKNQLCLKINKYVRSNNFLY